jgi:hypothetical protein
MKHLIQLQAVFRAAEQIAEDTVLGIPVDMVIESFHHRGLRFIPARRQIIPYKTLCRLYPPVPVQNHFIAGRLVFQAKRRTVHSRTPFLLSDYSTINLGVKWKQKINVHHETEKTVPAFRSPCFKKVLPVNYFMV